MIKIDKESYILVKKCLMKHGQHLLWVLDSPDYIDSPNLLNEIRDVISNELVESGLNETQTAPNEYGVQLEKLIDIIGRIFLN